MDSPAAILRRHGLRPKKSFGQCFLHDPKVVARIVDACGVGPGDTVVEIGAGLGILTEALAGAGARVLAVERDRDLARVLRERFAGHDRIELLEQNALELDLASVGRGEPLHVAGNLPYNIASPLLFHLLAQRRLMRAATLMLQREVAERLTAPPGSRTYGAPSAICQRVARVELCLAVGRGAFYPRPRVDSAVIRLEVLQTPRVEVDDQLFSRVVHAAFRFRRKTLRRALGRGFPPAQVALALEQSGISGDLRGEVLSVEDFGRLALALEDPPRG
jgi:16S rRNA (adenine1518-N6/adenine1519-N6)-dimethyltransferase